MPRPTRNRRSLSNTVNPAAMEIGHLLALPRQSLVLLASARNLMVTGSKARLAERIHAFEHPTPTLVGPLDVAGPSNATRPPLSINVDQTPVPVTAFSDVQITQLRSLISAAVLNERAGLQQPQGLAVGSLLSPATSSFGGRPNWVAKCGYGQPRDPSF